MSASSNKFGTLFTWSTFGESHGPAMGVVIDGCPAGMEFDESLLVTKLESRRPGKKGTSARVEMDSPEVLSGVFAGKTLGTPIAIVVKNTGQRSEDYLALKGKPRVGHADDLWEKKFQHFDHRGGGRASARETLNWVAAGAVAEMLCKNINGEIEVSSELFEVGGNRYGDLEDPALLAFLEEAKAKGESYGATLDLVVKNPPQCLGEPIFKKMKSELARAYMSINACCGVELGDGFAMAKMRGTQAHTDADSAIYGGLRGGLSTGENIGFRLAFKPTSSILDVAKKGRHDPCVALRALPVAEAMTWNVLADLLLMQRLNRL